MKYVVETTADREMVECAVVVSGHQETRGVSDHVYLHCTSTYNVRGVTEHYKPYRTEPNMTQSAAIDSLG